MPLDVILTTDRIRQDPNGRELVRFFRENSSNLELDEALLYYDFPTYADYETVTHKPDALLLSPIHGVVAIRVGSQANRSEWNALDESLGQFCSLLIGRLLKSRVLRANRAQLRFDVVPLLFIPGLKKQFAAESDVVTSFQSLGEFLNFKQLADSLSRAEFSEARSVIEGAKALTRAQKRVVPDPRRSVLATALATVEAEIANFDEQQRRAAIISVDGAQRIRGLAGSGKTVILAMKAAHLHLNHPGRSIAVTFSTKSLRSTLTNLITRFFRHYKDEDPDWQRLHVRHGWGGAKLPGIYADAARRADRVPLTFVSARSRAGRQDPFDYATRALLGENKIQPYYDYVLIDEGQDFPSGFYELCYALAKGDRDEKSIVWAYDELQNIFNVKMRTPEELFGTDEDSQPRVSLQRKSSASGSNDVVLSKCYRNQREVLVTAHAIGFGIYGDIVQLLESHEHWQDVGYEVESGDFKIGKKVRILRPEENSPSALETPNDAPLIATHVAPSLRDEVKWVVEQVQMFLAGGLNPEDLMVVCLDDFHAREYFREISQSLAMKNIKTNNIIAPYTEPPFYVPEHITLSTVYRAKGNESAVVFAIGIDGVSIRARSGRNKLFTAFTRTKGWLRVSGIGQVAVAIVEEIKKAKARFPHLEFTMPDLQKVELIQRDLSAKQAKLSKLRQEYRTRLLDAGFTEEEIEELGAEVADGFTKRPAKH